MADSAAGHSAPTAGSTDSGQGTGSLSDAFVAAASGEISGQGSRRRIQAPEGSSRLSVRRSVHVASSRSKSVQSGMAHPSVPDVIEAPPGVRCKIGYAHQVLQAVTGHRGIRSVVQACGPHGQCKCS
jgi:hypothetical protein